MKSKFLLLFLLAFTVGAGAEDLDVQGIWKKPCETTADQDLIQESLEIKGQDWLFTFTGFEEAACQKPYLTYALSETAIFSENGQVDFSAIKGEYTFWSPAAVQAMNEIEFCGFKDWQVNVVKVVTGKQCGDLRVPQRGEVQYSRFLQEKAQLFLGVGDRTNDGSSPEKRHQQLAKVGFVKEK